MLDVLGARLKLAVLIPSTNTVVEPEYYAMAPPGVTVHAGRLRITNPDTGSDAAFVGLMDQVRAAMPDTVARVMTSEPTQLALGMTAVSFLGGLAGETALVAELEQQAGVPVVSGPAAVAEALRHFGGSRIAVITPYQPVAEGHVRHYFDDVGQTIVRTASLRSPNATAIAHVNEAEIRALAEHVDVPEVDVIVQLGTNLAMVRLIDDLERTHAKPVVTINQATLWKALRDAGIRDAISGFGSLLRTA